MERFYSEKDENAPVTGFRFMLLHKARPLAQEKSSRTLRAKSALKKIEAAMKERRSCL